MDRKRIGGEIKNSHLKTNLMRYLAYRLHHKYLVSEGPCYSDVYSINRAGYAYEFEIKRTKSDLEKELDHIFNTSHITDWHRADHKYQKHHYYSMGKSKVIEQDQSWFYGFIPHEYKYIPNKYVFFVPEEYFAYLAIKISNLPYGIMTYNPEHWSDYWMYQMRKQPDFLHKEKATNELIENLLNRSTNELVEIREQLMNYQIA